MSLTIEEFKEGYLREYTKFSKTDLFRALIDVIHGQSPICESISRTPGDMVVAGGILFAEAKSHQSLIHLLSTSLLEKPKQEQPAEDYKTPPEI